MKPLIRLNMRQKVTIGFLVCLLAIGAVGGASYLNLAEMERKIELVEGVDDLSNLILEIRRYEKNYLLFGGAEDLREAERYIAEGLQVLAGLFPVASRFDAGPMLERLREGLLEYVRQKDAVAGLQGGARDEAVERLREMGKELVDQSRRIAAFERGRILRINNGLKTSVLASMGAVLAFWGVLLYFLNRQVLRPLRVIEDTTRRIGQGRFEPVPIWDTGDETQRVMKAFNRMVVELERRQDQLVQARKLSSIGTLASGIAHQLNNPLNNIATSCQILSEEFGGGLDEFANRLLGNIEGEAFRARDIVRGLLEFSREQQFSPQPVRLAEVVERSVRLLSSQTPTSARLETDIPEDLELLIDRQRMQEVFINLLMNGMQALEGRPGRVAVRASKEADGMAQIVVEDDGQGIPEAALARVFDPFYTTKSVGVGTGLGLYVVYGIIQKHKGTIAVESREGQGARFVIRLPLAVNEDEGESAGAELAGLESGA